MLFLLLNIYAFAQASVNWTIENFSLLLLKSDQIQSEVWSRSSEQTIDKWFDQPRITNE